MTPKGPKEGSDNPVEKNCALVDIPTGHLQAIVSQTLSPKHRRLILQEADAFFSTGSLRGAFTRDEANSMQQKTWGGLYEISDITGSALRQLAITATEESGNPHEKPFDLSMSVSHIFSDSEETFETTPKNLIWVHIDQFDQEDWETFGILEHINNSEAEGTDTALVLEVRSSLLSKLKGYDDTVGEIDASVKRFEAHGYKGLEVGYPSLSASLQSAIGRSKLGCAIRPSCTITDALGPQGMPIIVHSAPGMLIRLSEQPPENHPFQGQTVVPTGLHLVKNLRTD